MISALIICFFIRLINRDRDNEGFPLIEICLTVQEGLVAGYLRESTVKESAFPLVPVPALQFCR